jgi:hypothetical protein
MYSGLQHLAIQEKALAADKSHNFRGTVRVRLNQLQFSSSVRPLDQKIVHALKRDFRAEGCLQHQKCCSIPALITESDFSAILEHLRLTPEALKIAEPQPEIPSAVQLECLHGQHRISAARDFLPLSEHWWLVDLYINSQLSKFCFYFV